MFTRSSLKNLRTKLRGEGSGRSTDLGVRQMGSRSDGLEVLKETWELGITSWVLWANCLAFLDLARKII